MDIQVLRDARKEAKITQKAMGSYLGVCRETIIAIENKHPKTVKKLSIDNIKNWIAACHGKVKSSTIDAIRIELIKYTGC